MGLALGMLYQMRNKGPGGVISIKERDCATLAGTENEAKIPKERPI